MASLVDANTLNTNPHDYAATIFWGDGSSSAGGFKLNSAGHWDVFGSHKYTSRKTVGVSIQIHDVGGNSTGASCNIGVS